MGDQRQSIKQGPKELQLMGEGESLYKKQQYQKAEKAFLEVTEINPQNVEASFWLGNIYYNTGQIEKGIKAFKTALQYDPDHTEASICLSVLYNDIGLYQEAKALFNEVNKKVKQYGKNSSYWSSVSSESINSLERVGSYDSTKPQPQFQTQANTLNVSPLEKTSNEIEGTLSKENYRTKSDNSHPLNDPYINKKFAFKHYEMGDLYFTYDRYDEALFEYNKSIRLDPSNLDARIQVAKVYAKKGYTSKAMDELKRLKNENPNFLPARTALGILYYGNGQVIEAQNEWHKVLTKDGNNKEARMYYDISMAATETRI